MNSRTDLLFVSIHGASMTFDPNSVMADGAQSASTADTTAKKGACGKCTICKCKRALG